jgi:hypothetical protein
MAMSYRTPPIGVIEAILGRSGESNYTDNAPMDEPLSFEDMKTLNATLRMYNIRKEEFMHVINRYIAIKVECSE